MQNRNWHRWQVCDDEYGFNQLVDYLYSEYGHRAKKIFLQGDLGAGKTTFARRWLACMGVVDRVRSPTFSVVETYHDRQNRPVHHFDLYRFSSSEEIYCLGMDAYVEDTLLVEWPERGMHAFVQPDLLVEIRLVEAVEKREIRAFFE